MEFHACADLWPSMADDEFDRLVESIGENGQQHPIEVLDGKIIDGRHRFLACRKLGVEPKFADVNLGDVDPMVYTITANADRRHLTPSQRALMAARMLPHFEAAAKERQRAAGGAVPEKLPEALTGDARDQAGALLKVSGKTVDMGQKVLSAGQGRLTELVNDNEVPVSVAAQVAGENKTSQREFIKRIDAGETPAGALRGMRQKQNAKRLNDVAAVEAKAVEGVFDVVVIDPPWPVQKVERDERPNQPKELDYPTMALDEILALKIPASDDCHLWLWTTCKLLPVAFGCLEGWGFKYVCPFVWVKPGGFQPTDLPQYNVEFALYARRGAPQFVDTKDFKLAIVAGRGRHSEKPEEFYDLVRRVTAGRRLDMFNRRAIEGFDAWGKESGELEKR